jgi:hypothetical protein
LAGLPEKLMNQVRLNPQAWFEEKKKEWFKSAKEAQQAEREF